MRKAIPLVLLCGFLSGCVPIEPDVSKDGQVLIPRQEGFFVLDPANGELRRVYEVRRVGQGLAYAVFSPKGTRVLVGEEQQDKLALKVGDVGLEKFVTVAEDTIKSVGSGMGPTTAVYPSWLDEDTVLYLAQVAAYGTDGKNLHLVTVGADGKGKKDFQGAIETQVLKIEAQK